MPATDETKGNTPTPSYNPATDDPPEDDLEGVLGTQSASGRDVTTPSDNVRPDEAEQIRCQVDSYFSDENLQKDNLLLQKMKGRKNHPVPIKVIAGFAGMRQYQPLSFIVQSLKASNVVNVVQQNGQDCIQRKVPFVLPEHLKSKKSGKRSALKPEVADALTIRWAHPRNASGFEDYWAEGPIPPDVAAEEASLYDPDENSLEERLENAIHRYMSRRKFDSKIRNYFYKWMSYGGIDVEPKSYTSNVDSSELEGMTAKEKKIATTPRPYVCGEEADEEGNFMWELDIEHVVKSFLSVYVPNTFQFTKIDEYFALTNVMANFLRYLQFHRVCVDHTASINAALRICDRAAGELPKCENLQANLPGLFNTAASALHGGYFENMFTGSQEWNKDVPDEGVPLDYGLNMKGAFSIFAMGFVAYANVNDNSGKAKVAKPDPRRERCSLIETDLPLEIVEVIEPTKEQREQVEAFGNAMDLQGFQPLGKLVCKRWFPPTFEAWDLPESISSGVTQPQNIDKTFTFLLEEPLLNKCMVGFKFESTTVRTLTPSGLQILDGIPTAVHCSFYTRLENELVQKWKAPQYYSREEQKEREAERERMMQPLELVKQAELEALGSSGAEGADDDFD